MKHYIKQNIASPLNYYWNQAEQGWTHDPHMATKFQNDQEAWVEAQRAEEHAEAEVLVCVYAPKGQA